jgi:CheY-like chemotaxis protein
VCILLFLALHITVFTTLSHLLCIRLSSRPILDGLGATRRIRELEQEGVLAFSRPIVAVSGNARSEWTDRARDAGMDGFLRKPYNKAELQELLDRWRSGQRGAGTS